MYPPIEPHDSGHLDVGDGHEIYWETVGSPDGNPVEWLYGGSPCWAAVTSVRRRETQWITRDMGRVFSHQRDRFAEDG